MTIPLVSNLLKYPYYFWKFESKIKKNNDNSQKCVELYPPAARSIVKKLSEPTRTNLGDRITKV